MARPTKAQIMQKNLEMLEELAKLDPNHGITLSPKRATRDEHRDQGQEVLRLLESARAKKSATKATQNPKPVGDTASPRGGGTNSGSLDIPLPKNGEKPVTTTKPEIGASASRAAKRVAAFAFNIEKSDRSSDFNGRIGDKTFSLDDFKNQEKMQQLYESDPDLFAKIVQRLQEEEMRLTGCASNEEVKQLLNLIRDASDEQLSKFCPEGATVETLRKMNMTNWKGQSRDSVQRWIKALEQSLSTAAPNPPALNPVVGETRSTPSVVPPTRVAGDNGGSSDTPTPNGGHDKGRRQPDQDVVSRKDHEAAVAKARQAGIAEGGQGKVSQEEHQRAVETAQAAVPEGYVAAAEHSQPTSEARKPSWPTLVIIGSQVVSAIAVITVGLIFLSKLPSVTSGSGQVTSANRPITESQQGGQLYESVFSE